MGFLNVPSHFMYMLNSNKKKKINDPIVKKLANIIIKLEGIAPNGLTVGIEPNEPIIQPRVAFKLRASPNLQVFISWTLARHIA